MDNESNYNDKLNSNNTDNSGSWNLWQRLVLSELKRHDRDIETLQTNFATQDKKFAVMQAKMIMIGAVISAALYGLFSWVFGLIKS